MNQLAPPISFTIDVTQDTSGQIEMQIKDVTTDKDSRLIIAWSLEQLANQLRKSSLDA